MREAMPKQIPFFLADGREFHAHELDLDTKTDIADRVTAVRLAQCDRMFKKGLRTADEYISDTGAAFVSYGSKAFSHALLQDVEQQKAFVRAILVEKVDEATFEAIIASKTLDLAIKRLHKADDPGDGPTGDPNDPKAGRSA